MTGELPVLGGGLTRLATDIRSASPVVGWPASSARLAVAATTTP